MAKRKKGDWYYFVVEGAGAFPFDMLRYDSCWPVREGYDSGKLERECRERRRVLLATSYEGSPTPRRWESFMWKVVAEGSNRYEVQRSTEEGAK